MQIAVNCWSIFFLWSYRTWCSYSLSVLMAFSSYPFSIYLKFSVFLCALRLCFLVNFYLTTNSQILWASKNCQSGHWLHFRSILLPSISCLQTQTFEIVLWQIFLSYSVICCFFLFLFIFIDFVCFRLVFSCWAFG